MNLIWSSLLFSLLLSTQAIEVRHKYIVEFHDEQGLAKRSVLGDASDAFHDILNDHGFSINPRHKFSFPSFKGTSFQVVHRTDPTRKRDEDSIGSLHYDERATLEYIRSLPEVKSAWAAQKMSIPQNFDFETHLDADSDGAPTNLRKWSSLDETNVSKVHAMGITGANKVVAVFDTGVNYTHPALGGGIGPNFKVIGGYNYIEDDSTTSIYDRGAGKIVSNDPMDCYGHGTLVAGVIAGNSSKFTGVAPNAKIAAYRVFDCQGDTSDEILMAAFAQAKKDKVDVINLSLGSNRAWSQLPLARLASDLVHSGIAVVTSAGNEGYYGPFSAGSFGAGDDVLSVGSLFADEVISFAVQAKTGSNSFKFEYVSLNGTQSSLNGDVTFDVVNVTACSYSTLSSYAPVKNTRAIVPKGNCDLFRQMDNLASLDYTTVILYNSNESDTMYYEDDETDGEIEVLFSPRSFGKWAGDQKKSSVTISFDSSSPPIGLNNTLMPHRMDNSSSWGPTYDNKFYPSVSAPGGFIFTSNNNGSYSVTRGTSFSAPYVAGIAALFLESKKIASPQFSNIALEFNSRIISSSSFIRSYNGLRHSEIAQPTVQQGAGIVDALKLIQENTVILSEPVISLNDTRYRKSGVPITVYNGNDKPVTYSALNFPAASVYCKDRNGKPVSETYPSQSTIVAQALIAPAKFTLQPGQSRTVAAFFMPARILENSGVSWGGKIVITGDNGESIGVPYMGQFTL